MNDRHALLGVAWCVAVATLCTPTAAHAYLDPASGSMLLQLLLGGIAGIAVAVRLFWHRFRSFLSPRKSDDNEG